MAQTALPFEFSGSRDSTITILISILNSFPIVPMVKVRLLEMSRAERPKSAREMTKESNPIRRPELLNGNWPIKTLGVGRYGGERNLREQFKISWKCVSTNLWHLEHHTGTLFSCRKSYLWEFFSPMFFSWNSVIQVLSSTVPQHVPRVWFGTLRINVSPKFKH